MRIRQIYLLSTLTLATAFLFVGCTAGQSASPHLEWPPSLANTVKNAPTVSFCALVSEPNRFDKQIVRTKALFAKNLENASFHDPVCNNIYVWVEFDPAYDYSDDLLKHRFEQIACLKQPRCSGKALLTVVGRFEGSAGGPYGHLDGYTSRFSIIRLEQAEEVEALTSRKEN